MVKFKQQTEGNLVPAVTEKNFNKKLNLILIRGISLVDCVQTIILETFLEHIIDYIDLHFEQWCSWYKTNATICQLNISINANKGHAFFYKNNFIRTTRLKFAQKLRTS